MQAVQERVPLDGRPLVKENVERWVELDTDQETNGSMYKLFFLFFFNKGSLFTVFTLFHDSNNYDKICLFSIGCLLKVLFRKLLKRRKGQKLSSYLLSFFVFVSVIRRLWDPGCNDLSSGHFYLYIAMELVKRTSGVQFVIVIGPSGAQFDLQSYERLTKSDESVWSPIFF